MGWIIEAHKNGGWVGKWCPDRKVSAKEVEREIFEKMKTIDAREGWIEVNRREKDGSLVRLEWKNPDPPPVVEYVRPNRENRRKMGIK